MDYKEISKFFIDYEGDVQINPFAKVHWGVVKQNTRVVSCMLMNLKIME